MSVQTRLFTLSSVALAVALTSVGVTPPALAGTAALSVTPAISLRPAAAPWIPAPPRKALPRALDLRTPYQAQVSCDPRIKPGVAAFAALMRAHYKTGVAGLNRNCLRDISEHYDGRALDWMLNIRNPRQRAIANSVVSWLSARNGVMARRLGVSYMIWNRRMWREYAPARGWAAYSGVSAHTDHIHFSFSWDGAMKRTSWWTGRATRVVDKGPCRVYAGQYAPLWRRVRTAACRTSLRAAPSSAYPTYTIGQRSSHIALAQRRLRLTADGSFGMGTFRSLVSWQARARVPVTGVLDRATWSRLFRALPVASRSRSVAKAQVARPVKTRYTAYKRYVLRQGSRGYAVKVLQRALRLKADGAFGARTRSRVLTFQRAARISRNGVVGRVVWDRLERRDYRLVRYHRLILKQGSRGAVVALVQRVLRVPADGRYGARTAARVRVVQARSRLGRTGVVRGWTWVAIGRLVRR